MHKCPDIFIFLLQFDLIKYASWCLKNIINYTGLWHRKFSGLFTENIFEILTLALNFSDCFSYLLCWCICVAIWDFKQNEDPYIDQKGTAAPCPSSQSQGYCVRMAWPAHLSIKHRHTQQVWSLPMTTDI